MVCAICKGTGLAESTKRISKWWFLLGLIGLLPLIIVTLIYFSKHYEVCKECDGTGKLNGLRASSS